MEEKKLRIRREVTKKRKKKTEMGYFKGGKIQSRDGKIMRRAIRERKLGKNMGKYNKECIEGSREDKTYKQNIKGE